MGFQGRPALLPIRQMDSFSQRVKGKRNLRVNLALMGANDRLGCRQATPVHTSLDLVSSGALAPNFSSDSKTAPPPHPGKDWNKHKEVCSWRREPGTELWSQLGPHGAHPSSASWHGGPAHWAVRPRRLLSPPHPCRGLTVPQSGSALGLGPQTCLLPELLARWCLQARYS